MGKKKILIVEDEMIVAYDIQFCLEKLGYDVIGISATGNSALEITQKVTPDLILMDVRIQGKMNGIETTKRINENYHIPVIYLTANGDATIIKEANKTHHYGYLLKPFNDVELDGMIRNAILQSKLNN